MAHYPPRAAQVPAPRQGLAAPRWARAAGALAKWPFVAGFSLWRAFVWPPQPPLRLVVPLAPPGWGRHTALWLGPPSAHSLFQRKREPATNSMEAISPGRGRCPIPGIKRLIEV